MRVIVSPRSGRPPVSQDTRANLYLLTESHFGGETRRGGQNTENRILHCSQTVPVRRNRQRFRYASKTGKATLPLTQRRTRKNTETIFTFLSSPSSVESDVGVLSKVPKVPNSILAAEPRQPPTPSCANFASVFGNTQMQRFSFLLFYPPEKRRRTPCLSKHDGRTVTARGNAAPWAPRATVPRYTISASAVRCAWLRLQGR